MVITTKMTVGQKFLFTEDKTVWEIFGKDKIRSLETGKIVDVAKSTILEDSFIQVLNEGEFDSSKLKKGDYVWIEGDRFLDKSHNLTNGWYKINSIKDGFIVISDTNINRYYSYYTNGVHVNDFPQKQVIFYYPPKYGAQNPTIPTDELLMEFINDLDFESWVRTQLEKPTVKYNFACPELNINLGNKCPGKNSYCYKLFNTYHDGHKDCPCFSFDKLTIANTLKRYIKLCDEHKISNIKLKENDNSIRIKLQQDSKKGDIIDEKGKKVEKDKLYVGSIVKFLTPSTMVNSLRILVFIEDKIHFINTETFASENTIKKPIVQVDHHGAFIYDDDLQSCYGIVSRKLR